MDAWLGIIAVLVGLVTCFYGYPLFRILLVLAGLIVGYAVSPAFFPSGHPWLSLVVGVAAALVMALLAYPLWSIGVTVSGAALGFIILSALGAALNASQAVILLLGAAGAVILGVLFFQLKDLFVMLTTAMNGAVEVVLGLGWLIPALAFRRGAAAWLVLSAVVMLAALGFAVQYSMFKDRRTYAETPLVRVGRKT